MGAIRKLRLSTLISTQTCDEADDFSSLMRRRTISSFPSPSIANSTQNDDEAERRRSRTEISINEQESTTSLNEAADSLSNCLKLFAENKINKENAWSLNIIDSFAKLIQKHHHVLSNFQVAGTTLEASAKVYGLRVDSIYLDVVRMTADLGRQTAKALTKKGNRQPDCGASDSDQTNGGDKENLNLSNHHSDHQPKAKKAKKKKNVCTVTKNPESLNARLDTIPLTDPFFAKLNSVICDTTSLKRLMQNIIPTEDSKLKLRQNMAIWNSKEQKEVNFVEETAPNPLRKVVVLSSTFGDISRLNVRLGLAAYRLCNEPIEKPDDLSCSMLQNRNDDLSNSTIRNALNLEQQFDINAAVEQVAFERSILMDFGEMDQGDFEDLDEMDQVAVNRCKGLRRQAIVIEDMQPEETSHLEYAYRAFDTIDQFWAGPSHWKFRQSRRTNNSISRASQLMCMSKNACTKGQRPKVNRKRKLMKKMDAATLKDVADVAEDADGLIVRDVVKLRGTQLSNYTITRKWNRKNHKLPRDFKVHHDIFDGGYIHAPGLQINSNTDVAFTDGNDDDAAPYDYNNETDRDYCGRAVDMQSDTNTDIGRMDNSFDNLEVSPPPSVVPVDELPDFFAGAPERTEKISIAFARRAKVVDMKQLKDCTWSLISNKHLSDPTHNPTFSETLKDLPKVLPRAMNENISMPLAFYSVLHLCNDKGLQLNQTNDTLKDFEIEFPNEN